MDDIKPIAENVRDKLSASYRIGNFCQCVEELIYNSIDANATAVAVRVDVDKFKIQVVDKAEGISESYMRALGERYFTSKTEQSLSIGFKGEVIASVIELSKECLIETTTLASDCTIKKCFLKGKLLSLKKSKSDRTCAGTTVTVKNLFYTLPVRQNRQQREFVLEQLIQKVTALSVCHSNISFSLRDESTAKILVQSRRMSDSAKMFKTFFGSSYPYNLAVTRQAVKKSLYEAQLYVGPEPFRNSLLQFVFINGRPVFKTRIHRLMSELFTKNSGKSCENLVYVLKVNCPRSEVDIFDSNSGESFLHFKNIKDVEELLNNLTNNGSSYRDEIKAVPTVEVTTEVSNVGENSITDLLNSRDVVRSEFVKNPKLQNSFVLPKEVSESLAQEKVPESVTLDLSPVAPKNFINESISLRRIQPQSGTKKFHEKISVATYGIWTTELDVVTTDLPEATTLKNLLKLDGLRLTKDMMPFIRVINQIDNKFICCVLDMQQIDKHIKLLLMFDQHAVSERICLEKLFSEHLGPPIARKDLVEPIRISMDINETRFVFQFADKFEKFGVTFAKRDTFVSFMEITSIPQCFSTKKYSDLKHFKSARLYSDVLELIRQIIDSLKSTDGNVSRSWIPKIIRENLNSVACRSAVKFGDQLSIEECESMIENLNKCQNPFECAHGRPSVVPLADLGKGC